MLGEAGCHRWWRRLCVEGLLGSKPRLNEASVGTGLREAEGDPGMSLGRIWMSPRLAFPLRGQLACEFVDMAKQYVLKSAHTLRVQLHAFSLM